MARVRQPGFQGWLGAWSAKRRAQRQARPAGGQEPDGAPRGPPSRGKPRFAQAGMFSGSLYSSIAALHEVCVLAAKAVLAARPRRGPRTPGRLAQTEG